MIIDLKAAKAHHRAGRSLHGGTGLRHQNRRRAHVVTRTSDDHGRYHHLVACQISQESTTEVAVTDRNPSPGQRAPLTVVVPPTSLAARTSLSARGLVRIATSIASSAATFCSTFPAVAYSITSPTIS